MMEEAYRYTLSEAELRRIFSHRIEPFFRSRISRSDADEPTVVVVGGQPGAGKSRSMNYVEGEYRNASTVIGDDFRRHHPQYEMLMSSPETRLDMPDVTKQAAGRWVEMSIDYLRDNRCSVILETTMRQPDVVEATMRSFREAGYRCEVRVLAVPPEVSMLGVVERYAGQLEKNGAGRWAPGSVHDEAVAKLPVSLEKVAGSGLVDRVMVVDRAGAALYDSREHGGIAMQEVREALAKGRAFEQMDPARRAEWKATLGEVRERLARCGEDSPKVWAAFKGLEARGAELDAPKAGSPAPKVELPAVKPVRGGGTALGL